MSINVSGTNAFEPCPSGLHRAVCCDVIDHGMQETQFGVKHKVSLRFQTEELRDDGKPYLVSKKYTASIHPKATLGIDLVSWKGRAFTPEESRRFDLEVLIGVNCQINVIHKPAQDGGTWANIAAILPPAKGMPKLVVRDYIRQKDRDPKPTPSQGFDEDVDTNGNGAVDDDIPF